MTQKEKCRQYNIDNNIILSDKIFTDNNPNDLCDTTLSSSSCSMFSTITGTNQSTINNQHNIKLTIITIITKLFKRHCTNLSWCNCERFRPHLDSGRNIKEQLNEAKQLTSGVLFKCSTTQLGQTVFEAYKENELKKKQVDKQTISKMRKKYEQMIKKAR